MLTCKNGHEQCTRALLKAKANPNATNKSNVTALTLACIYEHEKCALFLLRTGANPDVKDVWGDTPRKIAG